MSVAVTGRGVVTSLGEGADAFFEALAAGDSGIVDGLSAPGLSLTLRAHFDVLTLVSNCPQINNPCNGFKPTPVRIIVEEG